MPYNEQAQRFDIPVSRGSLNHDLTVMLETAQAAYDKAQAELEAVKAKIKVELTSRYTYTDPVNPAAALPYSEYAMISPDGTIACTLSYSVSKSFNSKAFDAAHPGMREGFMKPSPRWTLRRPK